MGEAEAQEGARLANGGGHGRYAVSGRCQELGVVLVDEARGGQVGSDRVGGGDRFQASDVAALAGSPARRVDGNVRDIPGQASLADEGDAVDEVGTSDRGAGLDVDEGVDGSNPNKSAPVDGLADGSGPGVVVDDGGQAAVAGHLLGDIDAIPSGHAGRANDARALGIDGAGDCQGEAPTRTPAAFSWRETSSMTAVRTASGPLAMSTRKLVACVTPWVGSVRATRPWWAPSSTRARAPTPSEVTRRRALRPPVDTDSSVSDMTPASTRRETAAETVEAASPVCLTIAGLVSAWPEPISVNTVSSTS